MDIRQKLIKQSEFEQLKSPDTVSTILKIVLAKDDSIAKNDEIKTDALLNQLNIESIDDDTYFSQLEIANWKVKWQIYSRGTHFN